MRRVYLVTVPVEVFADSEKELRLGSYAAMRDVWSNFSSGKGYSVRTLVRGRSVRPRAAPPEGETSDE